MNSEHVIDASVAVKLFFDEGDQDSVTRALAEAQWRLVPDLFFLEFANVALKKVRRGDSSEAAALHAVGSIPRLVDEEVSSRGLFQRSYDWGVRFGFTTYDASYLVLAEVRGCTLLTADAKLERRARENGLGHLVQVVA